ncbi:hypothetical protein CALVIDRAFT_556381 [Calocera viscosa TUFC12733]|uniref:Uncharacterized protein n=1 Tax=Calocera viscosa (strain TUFC12733) TaxID=1330018 RepID=A0A167K705_CALVF|nr:hypothetical protein CALVIDRAFT_556381 [Calocera viscosa TUFC12733]
MSTLSPTTLNASASLLTLTKPKSEGYTCYFAECWAPSCPTHGIAQQHPPRVLPIPYVVPPTEVAWSKRLYSCGEFQDHPQREACWTPPSGGLTRSITASNDAFRCYAPTCEAINCPRHKRIVFPQLPPHSSVSLHNAHPALLIPEHGPYDCPDLAYDCSPSSASSTDSYLHTPTALQSSNGFFPPPTTVITPDSEEEDAYSRASIDSLSSFPSPPSIIVEPPSARSSMQSAWSVFGSDMDGYDGSSEMEGIPRRREMLGPLRPINRRKGVATHRSKGKENVRPERVLKHKPAVNELKEGASLIRGMLV